MNRDTIGSACPKTLGRELKGKNPSSFGLDGTLFKVSTYIINMLICIAYTYVDKLVRTLESHRYTLRAGRPPYPNLLKDLCSRLDFEGNDASPRTFEPEMKHFQEFNILLSILQEYGKGREVGFVKIKVPE